MESRLLLSGTELDTTLFNLDSFAADFAVISPVDSVPSVGASSSGKVVPNVPLVPVNPNNTRLSADLPFADFDVSLTPPVSLPTLDGPRHLLNVGGMTDTTAFDQGHGTAVAGIVGDVGTNEVGVAGVAPTDAPTSPASLGIPAEGQHETPLPPWHRSNSLGVVDGPASWTGDDAGEGPDAGVVDNGIVQFQGDLVTRTGSGGSQIDSHEANSVRADGAKTTATDAIGSDGSLDDDNPRFDDRAKSEGGMIAIEQVFAAVEERSLAAIADQEMLSALDERPLSEPEPHRATFAAADLSGELARAVAFEMIETEAAPIATTSARAHDRALAAGDLGAARTLTELSSSLGPIPLAAFAGAIVESHDSQSVVDWITGGPAEWLAGELVEAGRGDVAVGRSEQGAGQSGGLPRPVPAVLADWRTPMDVSAFLVVLALERFVSTDRRRDREVAGPPKPVCCEGVASNDSRRGAGC